MKNQVVYICMYFLFGIFLVPSEVRAQVSEGYIDLRNHGFQQSNYTLNGEWDFYKNTLLSPKDIAKGIGQENHEFHNVPALWKDMQTGAQNGMGYGTYRIRLKADPSFTLLSINLNKVQNAYKLWINDSLYAEVGKVGKTRLESEPSWASRNYTFINSQPENEIVIQVSNFYHKKGGIEHSPIIGLPNMIEKSSWRILGFDHFIMGLLLIMAIYHFSLFIIKRNEWAALVFGLLTLSSVMFSLTVGEIALTQFVPNFNWELLIKMNYIGNYARVFFFALFIVILFPSPFRRKTMQWAAGFTAVICLFILFTPARIFSHTLFVFFIYLFLMLVFFVGVTIDAAIKKHRGALFSLIGTAVLFIAVINDVVKELLLLNTPSTATYGLFIFVLLQADILAYRSTNSFKTLSKLTERLLLLTKIKDELLANNTLKPEVPLYIIAHNIKAQHSLAIVKNKNNQWQKVTEYYNGKVLDLPDNKVIDIDSTKGSIDYKLIQSAIQTKRTRFRFINETVKKAAKAGHPFSAVCMPVLKDGEIITLFYASNTEAFRPFEQEKQLLLNLIKPQLSVISQNALAYNKLQLFNKDLEETVMERTEEIIQQSEELRAQKEEIEEKNKILNEAAKELSLQNTHISDSIKYAERIQQAIFPNESELKKEFPNSYIFFKPKDILSGDFYWTATTHINQEKYALLAVADATGHGVPGALMAVIGDSLLSAAVYEKKLYKPSEIISYLDNELVKRLDKESSQQFETDGINISILAYNQTKNEALYAGAYQPLYVYKEDTIEVFKGLNKMAGIRHTESLKQFTYFDHRIDTSNAVFFLCTDGFLKQISDKETKKFTRKDFRDFLIKLSQNSFDKQATILEQQFELIKGSQTQTDDVLVAAIKTEQ